MTTISDFWSDDDDLDIEDPQLHRLLDEPSTFNRSEEKNNLNDKSISCLRTEQQHLGFDNNTGDTWIYPSNLPCRTYQLNITQAALYRNTLVVLPTGLGKTFIAAVVMYNIYRWYPRGKVVFMAPTRPLVNQQIEACQKLMPFPISDTAELTGRVQKSKRAYLWKTKRVFFATPQVVQSDACVGLNITDNNFDDVYSDRELSFPYEQIKLVVIDEAHKAKGRYAYTEVVQTIARFNKYFRVLALTATPGRTMDDVAEICHNLMIGHLEIRNESSIDVQSFIHKRRMETIVVKLCKYLLEVRDELLRIIEPYVKQLLDAGVLSGSGNLSTLNRNFLIFEQKRFRENSFNNSFGGHQQRHPHVSNINNNFSICISLYHALELLLRHGLYAFLTYFDEDVEGKTKFIIQIDRRLRLLIDRIKQQVDPNPLITIKRSDLHQEQNQVKRNVKLPPSAFGHPKFVKTHECLIEHFKTNKETRAIVFCEYRESVLLLFHLLLQEKPLLRPRCFVGQGGSSGNLRPVTQKQQLQIMNDFRSGISNILIATSIGEEGIDVGDVDLIVCFDISTSNPTRFIQRIGRTGRKRNGHVIMLVTEGREQQLLKEVLASKDQTNNKILRSSVVKQSLYRVSPRLVPEEFKPQCVRTLVNVFNEDENQQNEENISPKKKNENNGTKQISPKKKKLEEAAKGSQDLRQLFNKQIMNNKLRNVQLNRSIESEGRNDSVVELSDFEDFEPNARSDNESKISANVLFNVEESIVRNVEEPRKNIKISPKDKHSFLENGKDTSEITTPKNGKNNSTIGQDIKETIPVKINYRKLNKFLRTNLTTNEILTKANNGDLKYHLMSNTNLSNEMKLFLLKQYPEFVREQVDMMNILSAMDNNVEDSTVVEQSVRDLYLVIENLFGGKESVEDFFHENDLKSLKNECFTIEDLLREEELENELEFTKTLENILEGLTDRGRCCDNYDFIQNEYRNTKYYKNLQKQRTLNNSHTLDTRNATVEITSICNNDNVISNNIVDNGVNNNQGTSKVYDCDMDISYNTQINNTTESVWNESKYCSQLFQLDNKSTPIQRVSRKPPEISLHHMLNKIGSNDITFLSNSDIEEKDMQKVQIKKAEANLKTNDLSKETNSNSFLSNSTKSNEKHSSLITVGSVSSTIRSQASFKEQSSAILSPESCPKTSQTPTKEQFFVHTKESVSQTNLSSPIQHELEIDMDAFLEPLPEEAKLTPHSPRIEISETEDIKDVSKNENDLTNMVISETNWSLQLTPNYTPRSSLDVFSTTNTCNSEVENVTTMKRNEQDNAEYKEKQDEQEQLTEFLFSPRFLSTKPKPCKKSPSLFDLYMHNTKGKGKLPSQLPFALEALRLMEDNKKVIAKSPTKIQTSATSTSNQHSKIYIKNECHNEKQCNYSEVKQKLPQIESEAEESFISRPKKMVGSNVSKRRKIFLSDTDSDQECNEHERYKINQMNKKENEDEIEATQQPERVLITQHRKRRRVMNSFIDNEAAVSDSEADEYSEGPEDTIGGYQLDSVIVSDGDGDVGEVSVSHMKAFYLKSLKSPATRPRGAFKIPAPRVYNDQSRIYSQVVLSEEECSQYVADSFVVHGSDDDRDAVAKQKQEVMDLTECPLERAERIIKERSKLKKIQKLKKLTDVDMSSEDEEYFRSK